VNQPKALLLDEPSTGLDLISRQHLVDSMRNLAQQGITLVLVTHHIEEVIPEINRVVLMKGGRIFADGSRGELLRSGPLSEVFGGPIEVREDDGRMSAWVGTA
ncbi:MAG TPA: ABC transporter ATP-binding protein, partial [Stenotrophomonas sp.]